MKKTNRVAQLRERLGLSQSEFGKLYGDVGKAAVSQMETRISMNKETADKLHKAFGANIDWLLYGEGTMFPGDSPAFYPMGLPTEIEQPAKVKYYPDLVATASFVQSGQYPQAPYQSIPVLFQPSEKEQKEGFAVSVSGNSMAPQIKSGSKIFAMPCEKGTWHSLSEGIYIISYDDVITIKRIAQNRLSTAGYLTLSADNPAFGSMEVLADSIHSIWKVTRLIDQSVD